MATQTPAPIAQDFPAGHELYRDKRASILSKTRLRFRQTLTTRVTCMDQLRVYVLEEIDCNFKMHFDLDLGVRSGEPSFLPCTELGIQRMYERFAVT